MASLKGSHAGSIKMGSLTAGKSGESLPPLDLEALSQSGQGMVLNGTDSLVEKPEIKLGASSDMLQARILSAWCQSQGQLPEDSVRLERAADPNSKEASASEAGYWKHKIIGIIERGPKIIGIIEREPNINGIIERESCWQY